jgi:hypothetical protein
MDGKKPSGKRSDAFAQLKTATKLLGEGNAELARAQGKIKRAQDLIDESADMIRKTGKDKRD